MTLSISNIAWLPDEVKTTAVALSSAGIPVRQL